MEESGQIFAAGVLLGLYLAWAFYPVIDAFRRKLSTNSKTQAIP